MPRPILQSADSTTLPRKSLNTKLPTIQGPRIKGGQIETKRNYSHNMYHQYYTCIFIIKIVTQSFTKALKVSMLTYSNWTLFLQQKGGCGNRIGIDALQPKQDYLLLLIYSSGLELIIPISVLQKGLVVRPIWNYWGFGGRPLAAETRDPHSSSSLLVSSLCTNTSMKHKESFCAPVAVAIASVSSSSVRTCILPTESINTLQEQNDILL